jgi:hypothetical protein
VLRCSQLRPELGGRVRLRSTPCVFGHAYNQEDCCDGHERRLSNPALEECKVLDICHRDGAHLNEMFDHVQIVRMYTLAWEFARKKDVIRRKEIQFLVIKISNVRGPRALESSLPGKGRCFKQLFGMDCKVCKGTSV